MITLPSLRDMDSLLPMRIFLCLTPTDMRCGFDTLAQRVREAMGGDPLSGDLFLFTARRRDRLKILYWDRDGLAIWYKRLEEGTFRIPRPTDHTPTPQVELQASELAMLLEGIDLRSIRRSRRYTRPELPEAAIFRPPDAVGEASNNSK
ncbi:MAG: IS66 family insertion sequence element accessory protein TnpB [Phycisphaerae bacterium]